MKNFAHICIDASIMEDGTLGIGIFDITNKKKIALTYKTKPTRNAFIGESMALICAMEYAYKNGVKKVHFFTDNKELGDAEINPKFLKKFPFKEARISWIPRGLNKEADKMSKAGRNPNSGYWSEAANKTDRKIQKTEQDNIKEMFKKYNYTQKVIFLSKMAKSKQELEFIKMLVKRVKGDYRFSYNNETKNLIRMAKTIFIGEEAPMYVRKRLNKMQVQKLDYTKFEKEFNKRKAA